MRDLIVTELRRHVTELALIEVGIRAYERYGASDHTQSPERPVLEPTVPMTGSWR